MENTKIKNLAFGVVGIIIGLIISFYFYGNKNDNTIAHQSMNEGSMHDTMTGMVSGLSGKTGDAFDKAFIDEMITHHEGAVVMAESALKNAKHQEIKDMADAIISAQTKEINQMKEWRSSWYGN